MAGCYGCTRYRPTLEARDYPSPVSVAFFDRNGVILQMLDIDPCEICCPSYFPKVAYRGRLEVLPLPLEQGRIFFG